MKTVTAAEFNRYPSRVKQQALTEPVLVTDHGKPSVVVASYAEWDELQQKPERELNGWEALRGDFQGVDDWEIEELPWRLRALDPDDDRRLEEVVDALSA
jgi:prevent-host-death family protein